MTLSFITLVVAVVVHASQTQRGASAAFPPHTSTSVPPPQGYCANQRPYTLSTTHTHTHTHAYTHTRGSRPPLLALAGRPALLQPCHVPALHHTLHRHFQRLTLAALRACGVKAKRSLCRKT